MDVCIDKPQEFVQLAAHKKSYWHDGFLIEKPDFFVGLGVTLKAIPVYKWRKASILKQVEGLGRRVGVVRDVGIRRDRCEKIGKNRDKIERENDDAADEREPVLAEFPPHQL